MWRNGDFARALDMRVSEPMLDIDVSSGPFPICGREFSRVNIEPLTISKETGLIIDDVSFGLKPGKLGKISITLYTDMVK